MASTCCAMAQAYSYELKTSESGNSWYCRATANFTDTKSLIFDVTAQVNKTLVLSLAPSVFDDTNLTTTLMYVSKDENVSISIRLENGEELSTSQGKKGSISWVHLGTQMLKSNRRTFADSNDASRYAVQQLRTHNITQIRFNGITMLTPAFRSAATIDAMCRDLQAKTGNQSQYSFTDRNSSGSSSRYNAKANFYFSGTTRYITPPSVRKHQYIVDNLAKEGSMKVGTINSSGVGVLIRGTNGYAYTGETPQGLKDQIVARNKANENIIDVNVTERGNWVIIFGVNGYWSSGYPQAFFSRLGEYNRNHETMRSACFNDSGAWAIVTDAHFTGDDATHDFIKRAANLYGNIYSVFLTEMGKVACCEQGVYYENIPSTVAGYLADISFKPRFVKFTDSGFCVITDGNGAYWRFL